MAILFIGYMYSFEIVNQIVGAIADEIDKPHRPIPRGIITHQGARTRWVLSWILYPFSSYCLSGIGGMKWALIWQAWTYLNYIWPAPNNPISKNMFTAVGLVMLMAGIDTLLAVEYPQHGLDPFLGWCISVWLFAVIHIQDFHDMKGDKKGCRRSLPLVLGEERLPLIRQVTCATFFVAGAAWLGLGVWLASNSERYTTVIMVGITQLILGVALGIRVLQSRSSLDDKRNYFFGIGGLASLLMVYVALLDMAM